MPHIYGQELAEAKTAPADRDQTVWTEESFYSWLQEHDARNIGRFEYLLAAARSAGFTFAGSKTVSPAGSIAIFDRSNTRRQGTVSLFYFSGQGTSVEFNFTRMSRLPDEELPDAAVLDSFLAQLVGIDSLRDVAVNLRASRFASRKPNVPLSELTDDSIRKMVEAMATLTRTTA